MIPAEKPVRKAMTKTQIVQTLAENVVLVTHKLINRALNNESAIQIVAASYQY